ncbi:hypothetical protein CVT25_003995 [Psilocybe cyanescens]|uniref:Uncharacterized protein n=1 Tax=Psilocybe cyanescens TaxID=93625 RepID=A0A409WXQ4_PSICY|nr:hypothetical protein CVT25_003995 [Psilocybe cyanescens]
MERQADAGQTPYRFADTNNSGRRTYPVIIHVAVLSTFLIPIAFLPYIAARRQIVSLRRKVNMLEKDIQLFKGSVTTAASHQASIANVELSRLRETGLHAMNRTSELQGQISRQEADRAATDEEMRTGLRQLLDETQHSRTQTATLRALGMTLADIAAFMQEVELNFGLGQRNDQRGIERMRLLALRMQSLSQPEDHTTQVG